MYSREIKEGRALGSSTQSETNDIVRQALDELRSKKQLPVDLSLASDLTNPRNWYHNADSVRSIMRKVCDVNGVAQVLDSAQRGRIAVKGKKHVLRAERLHALKTGGLLSSSARSEEESDSTSANDTTVHSDKVKVPFQNSDDASSQSEMRVVITKTSHGNVNYDPPSSRNGITANGSRVDSLLRQERPLTRLPDMPHIQPSYKNITSSDKESNHVKLPILGKSMSQKNEEDIFTRPPKCDIKRIILGLYGQCFDTDSSGHYTYKKVRPIRAANADSPVHHVAPKFDQKSATASSKTLSMFQNKPSIDVSTRLYTTRKRNRRPKALPQLERREDGRADQMSMFPFPISNWTPREDEKNLLHKQMVLYHQQVAQENLYLLERDFLHEDLTKQGNQHNFLQLLPATAPHPHLQDDHATHPTSEKYSPWSESLISSPDADTIVASSVPLIVDWEIKLKKKREVAKDRRRRLEKIKNMKRSRNPHLEVVLPKSKDGQVFRKKNFGTNTVFEIDQSDKVPMDTKVYRIFGERRLEKTGYRQAQKPIEGPRTTPVDQNINIVNQVKHSSKYKVKEVC